MSELQIRIKQFILEKLNEDLANKSIIVADREMWVTDLESMDWYINLTSQGLLWYNSKYFQGYCDLFSLENKQISKILREWVEHGFGIRVNSVARKNSNLSYIIEKLVGQKKKQILELNNRQGFSYDVVIRYTRIMKETKQTPIVQDFLLSDGI